uniref:PDZ domain-containing protein n=1 Tax=Romanomermis culicivorax TaxID=13658 RepID=A0A915I919_ROMCU
MLFPSKRNTIDAKDRNNDNRSARCIKNENGLSAVENNRASFTAELTRKDGASLGFNIDGGVDKNAPPIISKLRPGSIAYRCDELQVGDFLIAVNGIKVLTLKYEEILILLRNATDTIILTIEYDLNTLCKLREEFTL